MASGSWSATHTLASGSGTFGSLIGDIASQVEYMLGDFFNGRGYDPNLAPMYAQMLVGMVAVTGQWWLDARKPRVEVVAAHLINLAWNGLSQLDRSPSIAARPRGPPHRRVAALSRRRSGTLCHHEHPAERQDRPVGRRRVARR